MKRVLAVIVWAIAFAYVEAAVVEYLRALYYPAASGGFRFPLLTPEQLQALGDDHWRRLIIEFGRELATLVMLVAIGVAAGTNRREAMAHFMIAFGVWDIFFYLWLKVFLDWPQSLMTWDLLFLFPLPWVSPVVAPVIISVTMILCGLVVLFEEWKGRVQATTWGDRVILAGGGVVVIAAFCRDYENIMQGGLPNPFNWPLFVAGLLISSSWFMVIVVRNRRQPPH